jgi:hypothetical protein
MALRLISTARTVKRGAGEAIMMRALRMKADILDLPQESEKNPIRT